MLYQHGFMHWLPTLLKSRGMEHDQALTMQFLAGLLAPVGPLLGAWSCERWQRKWLIVVLTLGLAATQLVFGLAGNEVVLTVLAALIVVGCNWFSAVFHAYQAELFPTSARATGVGFTYSWSRLSMAGVNLFMPGLIATDPLSAIQLLAAAFVGVAVIIGLLGPLTNAQSLEEIAG